MYNNTYELFKKCLKVLKQPPLVDIQEWADTYRVLDSTSSNKTGKFETKWTPYMIEIYKSITKGETKQFTLMMASQLAKSELIINIFGRYAHLDPCPMLIVQPTDEMARSFSKERIQPAIDNSILKTLIKDSNKKDSGNTVTHKMFPGGFIAFVGANSPSKLAARPIRIVFLDEVDRYPKSSGNEGSPIILAKKRTSTFDDVTKHIITGTPTLKGSSEIEDEYENSSKAQWNVPCPVCGKMQTFKWEKIKWDNNDPKTARMVCEYCKAESSEKAWKKDNDKNGKWIHEFPERIKNLGYQLSALASPFRHWDSIVQEWLEIKGDVEKLKAFINTVLAETFEVEYSGKLDAKTLLRRTREKYNYIPDKALILTAGVDIQDGWIAIEVVAWGQGFESWGMKYQIITGNMEQNEIWEKLDLFLDQTFEYKNGDKLKIYATCIDTGGHHTEKVYDFVSTRQQRRILGIKGLGGDNVPVFNGMRKTKDGKISLVSVGSNAIKDITMSRLNARYTEEGYCHFNGLKYSGYDLEYFNSLVSEVKIEELNKKVVWKKTQERNEGFDCRNYASVPFFIFNINPADLAALTREQLYELSILGYLQPEQMKVQIDKKGVEI